MAQLQAGLNIHDENTLTFFGMKKGAEFFKEYRDVSKMIQFGRLLYGGTDRGIYTKVKTDVPDCPLTFKEFVKAVENYFIDHPDFVPWMEKVQRLAMEERISVNGYGRVRSLYNDERSIKRQALNNPNQGTAGDFMTETMILLDEALAETKTDMVLQVHDELIFNVPDSELETSIPLIESVMNREVELNGYTFRIPVDSELGTHWSEQGEFDRVTFKVIGKSKH